MFGPRASDCGIRVSGFEFWVSGLGLRHDKLVYDETCDRLVQLNGLKVLPFHPTLRKVDITLPEKGS